MRRLLFVCAAIWVAGCAEPDPAGVEALFAIPRPTASAAGFYALPYPNDLRVDDSGAIDLAEVIRPNELVGRYMDALAAEQRGFSLIAPVFCRFSGPLDPTSLPQSPTDSLSSDASVYLVRLSGPDQERGQRVPVRFRFEPHAGAIIGPNWLAALPFPGVVLAERTVYGLVVTNRVRAEDGSPVVASGDFEAVLSGRTDVAPEVATARIRYRPLLDWLNQPGHDDRATVVAAAVFTTQDATSGMNRLYQAVHRQPAPSARDVQLVATAPSFTVYDGAYDGPDFQQGTPPFALEGGAIEFAADTGEPAIARTEALRFSVTVPVGPTPASGWPLVLYSHGTGGDYRSFVRDGTAELLARAGMAAASIDQVFHGARDRGGDPALSFYNLQNPLAARDNSRQAAIDNASLLRVLKSLQLVDRAGRSIWFDPERLYFFGHSQGGITGPLWLAYEPEIKGAVLSGAGGLLYLALLHKTEPFDVSALVRAVIPDQPVDEFNPILALVQQWLDPVDPAAYARLLVTSPPGDLAAKHLVQSEGVPDHFTPNPAIHALATALQLDQTEPVLGRVEGLELLGRSVLTPPVTANQTTTSVLAQYQASAGSDGHFVVFDVPEAQSQVVEFLRSLASEGSATLPARSCSKDC
jgi:predicted esterase